MVYLILLTAEKITKSYVEKKLLDNISFYLNTGDKIGVLGINGTGKSTFLKILSSVIDPDSGTLTKSKGLTISYLPQNPDFNDDLTIIEQVFKDFSHKDKELKVYEAKSILNKLGINDFDKKISTLSGGEKKRVSIATALIKPSDVLILDEPTNHIDSEMVNWLESYLKKYNGAIIMITHDRYFLDRISNKIIEIDNGSLYSYNANYSKFLELKQEREAMDLGTERKNKSLFRKELEWMQRGPRARGTKSKSRIEKFESLKSRSIPVQGEKLELDSMSSRLGKKTIELKNISKKINDKNLITDFNHIILKNSRIGIIGPNGCGKSTLLKIINQILTPDSGELVVGETVNIGYFSQECDEMDENMRVIDYIKNVSNAIVTPEKTLTASQMLEKFLFPPDLQWNIIKKLSGGEKKRLFLLKILMGTPNILLLDEPTNDLDIQTLTILEDYLETFQGAVIAVSHDRYFLDKVVNDIWAFSENGEIQKYIGGYSDYLDSIEDLTPTQNENKNEEKKPKNNTTREAKPQKAKFSFNEKREYETIDTTISEIEKNIEKTEIEIEKNASNYSELERLTHEKEDLEKLLEEKMERWMYLNDLAEKINNG
jgi:ABC transport system ATP-binding/permease protein